MMDDAKLMISKVPGLLGDYLVLSDAEGLHIVARLVGVSEKRRADSLARFTAWADAVREALDG